MLEQFEDDFDNAACCETNMPSSCHVFYEVLPIADEHNIARRSALDLERKWLSANSTFTTCYHVLI